MEAEFAKRLQQLSAPTSSKRRAAAAWLRKHPDPSAGDALLIALREELKDPRTWSSQGSMIKALGECGFVPALPFLRQVAESTFEASMVEIALGYAIFRLEALNPKARLDDLILDLLHRERRHLTKGVLQSVAVLRFVPREDVILKLVEFARSFRPEEEIFHLFLCSAAYHWAPSTIATYLTWCSEYCRSPVSKAAQMALEGKRWPCERNLS